MKPQKKNRRKSVDQQSDCSSSSLVPMLPPCRICGEKASGFHYGVNTCEACKAFFRRNLEKGSSYKCTEKNECEIIPGKRNSCSACRFRKCVALGMCKEAIKTGRYTHEKKAEDIKEVKRLEEGDIVCSPKHPSPKSVSSTVSVTDDELQSIIDSIFNSYMLNTPYTHEFYETLPKRELDYLEQKALQCEVFGPMKPVPMDEYAHILQTTGIDIDGRKEMFQHELPHIEKSIKRFIAFVKSIPGFNSLSVEDQITIIKNGKFEVWMIMCHLVFNPEHKLYCSQGGRILNLEEMTKLNDREFLESVFSVQNRIRKLLLTQEETCILAAMATMTTDDCVIKDFIIVDESQDLLLRCLLYLFRKNEHNEMKRFAQVVSCMLQLRTVKKLHSEAEEKLVKEWADRVEFPPIIYEMWSS